MANKGYRWRNDERETIIRWDADQKIASIYTAIPATLRKLNKLCEICPDEYTRTWIDADGSAARYLVRASLIRFGKPASERARAAASERGKRYGFKTKG